MLAISLLPATQHLTGWVGYLHWLAFSRTGFVKLGWVPYTVSHTGFNRLGWVAYTVSHTGFVKLGWVPYTVSHTGVNRRGWVSLVLSYASLCLGWVPCTGWLSPTQDLTSWVGYPTLSHTQDLTGCMSWVPCTSYFCSCTCLLYTSPSPRDKPRSRMPSSA